MAISTSDGDGGPPYATLDHADEVPSAVRALGIRSGRPVLVSVGGAAGMTPEHLEAMAGILRDHLVPAVERWGAAVVDGGTDSGVMRVMGEARAASAANFPLIGVAAVGTVSVPGTDGSAADAVELEPNHTHVLLVPGQSWGEESPWLSQVATVVAGGRPSLTLVVNGGEITYEDIEHSLAAGRPVFVVAGTGRTADDIAESGADMGGVPDERAERLAASPLMKVVRLDDPPGLTAALESHLNRIPE